MRDELDAQLRPIFTELFPVAASDIDDDARRGELEGWDSLAHLTLVAVIEQRFSVTLDPDQALSIETFGDAKRVVADLLAQM